ncbi:hypothetical protein KJS94_12455 [Flavihumibacter rivuli]|uniref:hypothetical protein n=1 Tax=Flavihumibacter rivuli TaxID=2838156 RepID=UPI001BDF2300|nr:hypothetical protein [Flavihumibacter rivuli]ULQ55454.1 hypothetical protein KJS94_12455 [Flavihumibacter rivuli]
MKWFSKLFDRIEMASMFNQHLTTFYHYEKKQFYNKTEIPRSDKFVFIAIPILLSIGICLIGLRFDKDYVNITLTCLSIFSGLLFSLLTLVLSLIQENQKIDIENIKLEERKKTTARIELTNHLFINIGFAIVLSIAAILFVLLTQLHPTKIIHLVNKWEQYNLLKDSFLYLTNGISFFLIIEFFLTLMMIVKRFTVLFINQTS